MIPDATDELLLWLVWILDGNRRRFFGNLVEAAAPSAFSGAFVGRSMAVTSADLGSAGFPRRYDLGV